MPSLPKIDTIKVPRTLFEENCLFERGQEVEFDGVKYRIQDITTVRDPGGYYFEYFIQGQGQLSIHQRAFWVRESALRRINPKDHTS